MTTDLQVILRIPQHVLWLYLAITLFSQRQAIAAETSYIAVSIIVTFEVMRDPKATNQVFEVKVKFTGLSGTNKVEQSLVANKDNDKYFFDGKRQVDVLNDVEYLDVEFEIQGSSDYVLEKERWRIKVGVKPPRLGQYTIAPPDYFRKKASAAALGNIGESFGSTSARLR